MPTLSLFGNFNLPHDQELETTLIGSLTHNEYSRDYSESDFLSHSSVKEQFYKMDASVKYNIQLKHQNTLSAQLSHFHRISTSNYIGDYDYWQHLWSAETLFFIVYNQNFGKKISLAVRPGISSLLYHLHGNQGVNHIAPRFNLRLIYRMTNKQQLRLSVALGNTFPDISSMNGADQVIDVLQIKRGNPNMDNATVYNTSLTYNLQVGQFNIQAMGDLYGLRSCPISDYYIEDDKLINSYRSDANYQQVDGLFSVTWKANEHFHVKADAQYSHYMITGAYDKSRNSFSGGLNANYFWKNFSVNLYGSTPTCDLQWDLANTRTSGKYGASINWSHGGWMAEVGTKSPFTKKNRDVYYMNTDVYNYYKSDYSRTFQQTGYVKLSYTLDFGRKISHTDDGVNTTVNSAILKVK